MTKSQADNDASGAKDSDISDLTDMDRLTQAIREIALRTVEKNPGPLLDSLI